MFKFKPIFGGYFQCFKDGKLIAIIEKSPFTKRFPYCIERFPSGHYVDQHGYDCFTLTVAKQEIRRSF